MNAIATVVEAHAFRDRDFVGGDVVLDFVNTVTGRNGRPRDWIPSFSALADWAALAGLLPGRHCQRLNELSRRSPSDAAAALGSARDLRELLFRMLTQAIDGRGPVSADLAHLHTYWRRGVEAHALRRVGGLIQPILSSSSTALDGIVSALAIRAVDLLRELQSVRLRRCAGPNCAWVFIDSSKAGRRRWCDMATCGNDAKARRHYLSKKKLSEVHRKMSRPPRQRHLKREYQS
jgi:predicted RNA-binding Zn ribbon-like protein